MQFRVSTVSANWVSTVARAIFSPRFRGTLCYQSAESDGNIVNRQRLVVRGAKAWIEIFLTEKKKDLTLPPKNIPLS
jgi:hypothetical protein